MLQILLIRQHILMSFSSYLFLRESHMILLIKRPSWRENNTTVLHLFVYPKFHLSEKGAPNIQSVIAFKPALGCLEGNSILMNNLRIFLFPILGNRMWFTSVKKKKSKLETFAPRCADKVMVKKVWVIWKPGGSILSVLIALPRSETYC